MYFDDKYNQSIRVFCPRAVLHCKLSSLHSTLFSAFLFVSSYSPFIIMLSIIYLLLPRTFFSFTIHSRTSFSRQFLLSQWLSQFLILFLISSSIILPSPTLSSTTAFVILPVHFTRSILLHTHISNASSCFCSFCRVQVSAPYNTTLHTKHFTSLFHSSLSKGPQKMLLFLLKASFAIAILCFPSGQQFRLLLILHSKYLKLSTCSMDSPLIRIYISSLAFFR